MERRVAPRPQRVLLVDDSADLRELWEVMADATVTAETFLPKPAEPDQLIAQIRATLRRGPAAHRES